MYKEKEGNIFDSPADALVNFVSCEGVMSSDMGRQYRKRFPGMHVYYKKMCNAELMYPGQILVYKATRPIILNFCVRNKEEDAMMEEWVTVCMGKFVAEYMRLDIRSIAFPLVKIIGKDTKAMMRKYLGHLDIDVEVYVPRSRAWAVRRVFQPRVIPEAEPDTASLDAANV